MKRYMLLAIIGLLFTACATVSEVKTVYTAPNTTEGKKCVQSCLAKKKKCKLKCNDANYECLEKTKKSATTKTQSTCSKKCSCEEPYQACFSSCGGKVTQK